MKKILILLSLIVINHSIKSQIGHQVNTITNFSDFSCSSCMPNMVPPTFTFNGMPNQNKFGKYYSGLCFPF
jgi:hypothetical protein